MHPSAVAFVYCTSKLHGTDHMSSTTQPWMGIGNRVRNSINRTVDTMLRHKLTVISLTMAEVKDLDNRRRFRKHLEIGGSRSVQNKPKAAQALPVINIDSCLGSPNTETGGPPLPQPIATRPTSPPDSPSRIAAEDGMGYLAVLRSERRRRRDQQQLASLEPGGSHQPGQSPSSRPSVGGRLRLSHGETVAGSQTDNSLSQALPTTAKEAHVFPGAGAVVELAVLPPKPRQPSEPSAMTVAPSTSSAEGSPSRPRSPAPTVSFSRAVMIALAQLTYVSRHLDRQEHPAPSSRKGEQKRSRGSTGYC
jgi:hypothetical protein